MDGGHDLARGDTRHGCETTILIHAVVDLQCPGHIGLGSVEFLVEPVAQASDGLRQDHTGGHGIGERCQGDLLVAEIGPHRQTSEDHGTPDTQASIGDLQGIDGVTGIAEVLLVVGDHMVDATTDDAGRNSDDRGIQDHLRVATTGGVALPGQPDGDDDAGDDAHRVGADREWTEVPHSLGRGWNCCQCHDVHRIIQNLTALKAQKCQRGMTLNLATTPYRGQGCVDKRGRQPTRCGLIPPTAMGRPDASPRRSATAWTRGGCGARRWRRRTDGRRP